MPLGSSQVDMQLWYSILVIVGPTIPARERQRPFLMKAIPSRGFLAMGEIFLLNHRGSNVTTPSCEAGATNNPSMPSCPICRVEMMV